jgi:hypothetical protein
MYVVDVAGNKLKHPEISSTASVISLLSNSSNTGKVGNTQTTTSKLATTTSSSIKKRKVDGYDANLSRTTSTAYNILFDVVDAALAVTQVTVIWIFFAKRIDPIELERMLANINQSSEYCSLVSDTLKCNTLEKLYNMLVYTFGLFEIANPGRGYKDCNIGSFRRFMRRDSNIGMYNVFL